MSLDLLKEKFGHSVKKEADNKENIHEKLNDKFNSDGMDDLKSFKVQYQEELKEKDEIIENLMQELGKQRLENKLAFNTKKIYEDKIKKISIVDFSTELISMLTDESRKKQGNQILDWSNWLKIPENKYLLQINEDVAKKVFQNTTDLIKRYISNINDTLRPELIEAGRTSRTRGGDEPSVVKPKYSLTFTGDTASGQMDYVTTDFNPDTYELWKGFTVSYWVRPDEEVASGGMFGRRNGSSEQRFFFGIHNARNWIGVGRNILQRGESKHEMEIGTGRWYHWVVTYEGDQGLPGNTKGVRKVYRNGELIWPDPTYSDGYIQWNQHSGTSGGGHNLYFGARNNNGNYTNGLACGLDEVAIFDEEKDSDWVEHVYDTEKNGKPNDLQHESGLVGYWRFEEGGGTTVEDLSGNGNHGTFVPIGTLNHAGGTITTALPTWSEDVP